MLNLHKYTTLVKSSMNRPSCQHPFIYLNTCLLESMYQASMKVDDIVLRSTMRAVEYVSSVDNDFALMTCQMTFST